MLITGEPRIGKTRTASEVTRRADGFRSVWSWCVSDAATSSYRPWIQVIRELRVADTHLADLTNLPALLSGEPTASNAVLDAEADRWQFFDAAADLIRQSALRKPLLIVLDDLHDAQESSLWKLGVPSAHSVNGRTGICCFSS